MPSSGWTSPFPPLQLSASEKEELIHTTESLVDDMVESYAEMLEPNARAPNPTLWTLLREREGLRAYRSNRPGAGTPNRNVYLILTVGTIVGNLNDVLYGTMSYSTECMRIKTAYTNDTLMNGTVLENPVSPTPEQPFRSVSVCWVVKTMPFLVRAMSKHRDTVFIDASGTRTLSNGQTMGYNLLQSVNFPSYPPLSDYDRSSISIITLMKQVAPNRVQIVTRSYFLLDNCVLESATLKSMADALISIWRVTQCAHKKKLAWLVQNPGAVKLAVSSCGDGSSCCSVCGDSLATRRELSKACAVCSKPTCKQCRIKHDLLLVKPHGQLVEKQLRFCVACVGIASRLDAAFVIQHEAATRSSRCNVEVPSCTGDGRHTD